jgi:hypothetical protein
LWRASGAPATTGEKRAHEALLGFRLLAVLSHYAEVGVAERYAELPRLWRRSPLIAEGVKVKVCGEAFCHRLGLKEVDDAIWLVSFMTYDLGYIDLEQRTLQPLDNPFGTRLLPIS